MPIIPFGEFAPDETHFGSPDTDLANNSLPGKRGFKPVGTLETVSSALDARARGAISVRDVDNNKHEYAGDAAKLYRISTATWTDSSIMGGYATGTTERWEFAKWNNTMIACNGFVDNPQQVTLGGTTFADLTGDSIRGRHVGVVRDFVVFGNTWDSTDTDQPQRVRWSAVGDETDYTVSATTQSGFTDLKTGGGVQAVVGGEYGVIVSERSVFRMSYVGSPQVFQFDQVLPATGTFAPASVVRHDDSVFFASEQGFKRVVNGQSVIPIGAGKVDEYFLALVDRDSLDRITATADPRSNQIWWAFPGAQTGGVSKYVLIYDVNYDKWSTLFEFDGFDLLWQASGVSYTLDGLDAVSSSIDALPASLDSATWQADSLQVSAFKATDFTHGFFTGARQGGAFTTPELELNAGRITHLNEFVPIINGFDGTADNITAVVVSRDRQGGDEVTTALLSPNASGTFTPRARGRYHRIRIFCFDQNWKDAIGVQIERQHARPGEGRG